VANAEAMFVGAAVDIDTDVIVSWLPCFHDMGMTGYLTVPMYFGVELVKVTPMDFLQDALLWPKLIDTYRGTMMAAPNFAYNLLAKRLRRQATPGQFDPVVAALSTLGRGAGGPAVVEDLCDAAAPFGLRAEAFVPAYGMAETTVAVSFTECGAGMLVDEVDADLLAVLHRAVPVTRGRTRRLVRLGRPLPGMQVRIVDEQGAVLAARGVGVIEVRGEPVTDGYTTLAGYLPGTGRPGLVRHRRSGLSHRYRRHRGVRPCQDVIIAGRRNIYPNDIELAAVRVDGVRPGCAVAVRIDAGQLRETFAVRSNRHRKESDEVRRIERRWPRVSCEVDVRPRNVVVLAPGTIPKTPSGKLRRIHAQALVH
jgi:fatty-acyl-CoA synthase